MIALKINGIDIGLDFTRFSDSACSVKLSGMTPVHPTKALITAIPTGSITDNLFNIGQVVNILRELNPRIEIRLFMPYIPYARQDRHMVKHDSFSLRVFADVLNSFGLDGVMTMDAHSDVAPALINHCVNIPQERIISTNPLIQWLGEYDVIVSPDAGASKKIHKVAQVLKLPVAQLEKVRDVSTGTITHTALLCDPSVVAGNRVIIVDDLCDGGGTFLQAAAVLRTAGAKSVALYITHSIFSRGIIPLIEGGIDHIYTTDSYCNYKPGSDVHDHGSVTAACCKVIADQLYPNWGC